MKIARLFRPAHIPALVIMGILFYFSSQSSSGIPSLHPPLDKVIHAFAYGILGGAFCLWVRGERWVSRPFVHALTVAMTCFAFGLTDEFHQSFIPGRSVSFGDLMADLFGSVLAIVIYIKLKIYRIADRYTFFRKTIKPHTKVALRSLR